jgi:hypothetical protein
MISKHCPQCDGENIFQQSFWRWSKREQDWVCDDDYAIICGTCGYSGYNIVTKKIEHESVATEGDLS